ncbi:MAG TPA: hypothetical protein VGA18_07850 [Rhodothermales bacterium]|jgi:hypothetical protein
MDARAQIQTIAEDFPIYADDPSGRFANGISVAGDPGPVVPSVTRRTVVAGFKQRAGIDHHQESLVPLDDVVEGDAAFTLGRAEPALGYDAAEPAVGGAVGGVEAENRHRGTKARRHGGKRRNAETPKQRNVGGRITNYE